MRTCRDVVKKDVAWTWQMHIFHSDDVPAAFIEIFRTQCCLHGLCLRMTGSVTTRNAVISSINDQISIPQIRFTMRGHGSHMEVTLRSSSTTRWQRPRVFPSNIKTIFSSDIILNPSTASFNRISKRTCSIELSIFCLTFSLDFDKVWFAFRTGNSLETVNVRVLYE